MKVHILIAIILNLFTACNQDKKIGDVVSIRVMDKSYPCQYDNPVVSLGIGLVIAGPIVEIYNDSLLTSKLDSFDMYTIDENTKINICSKYYKPDYGIMHFVCLKEHNNCFKVLVNYSTIYYLPKTKDNTFKTWEAYILDAHGISRVTDEEIVLPQPLRKKPAVQSDTLIIPNGLEMFCPIEIKGDWVKVKYDCFYNLNENPYEGEPCHEFINKCKNPVTGWLQWKSNNKILIGIFLIP